MPTPGTASANVVDNVQEIALIFRGTSNDMTKAKRGKPEGAPGQSPRVLGQKSKPTKAEEYQDRVPDASSRVDQLMGTLFCQLRDTLQSTIEARHTEETERILQGREDMENLRAELGDIQKLRHLVRETQELRGRLMLTEQAHVGLERELQKMRRDEARREELQQARRDEALREQVRQVLREEAARQPADADTVTTASIAAGTTNVTASTGGNTAIASTTTDPTGVACHISAPTPTSILTKDDDGGARDPWDHGADATAGEDEGDNDGGAGEADADEGRLLGDFLGRMLAREDWPEKKKPRRKTRKMYAIQAQKRAENQIG